MLYSVNIANIIQLNIILIRMLKAKKIGWMKLYKSRIPQNITRYWLYLNTRCHHQKIGDSLNRLIENPLHISKSNTSRFHMICRLQIPANSFTWDHKTRLSNRNKTTYIPHLPSPLSTHQILQNSESRELGDRFSYCISISFPRLNAPELCVVSPIRLTCCSYKDKWRFLIHLNYQIYLNLGPDFAPSTHPSGVYAGNVRRKLISAVSPKLSSEEPTYRFIRSDSRAISSAFYQI